MFSKYLELVEYNIYTYNCYIISTFQWYIDTLVIEILNNVHGSHHGQTELRL